MKSSHHAEQSVPCHAHLIYQKKNKKKTNVADLSCAVNFMFGHSDSRCLSYVPEHSCSRVKFMTIKLFTVPDFAILDRKQAEQVQEADFDPTIHGPWMNEWKIVNHNEHTAKLKEGVVSSSRFTIEISTKE